MRLRIIVADEAHVRIHDRQRRTDPRPERSVQEVCTRRRAALPRHLSGGERGPRGLQATAFAPRGLGRLAAALAPP
jgi:hypothetical protein